MKTIRKIFALVILALTFTVVVNAEDVPTYTCKYEILNACTVVISGNTVNSTGFSTTFEGCSGTTHYIEKGDNVIYNKFRNEKEEAYCPDMCVSASLGNKHMQGKYDFSSTCTSYTKAKPDSVTYTPPGWGEEVAKSRIKSCEIFVDGKLAFLIKYNLDNDKYDIIKSGLGAECTVLNENETGLKKYFNQFKSLNGEALQEAKCPQINAQIHRHSQDVICSLFTESSGVYGNQETDTEEETTGDDVNEGSGTGGGGSSSVNLPPIGFGDDAYSCTDLLEPGLTNIVKVAVTAFMIGGVIIAIANGMILLLPAVIGKDPDALKKAGSKCVKLAALLALILLLKPLISFIGRLFGFDLSCFL